jgi:hypothetical protein
VQQFEFCSIAITLRQPISDIIEKLRPFGWELHACQPTSVRESQFAIKEMPGFSLTFKRLVRFWLVREDECNFVASWSNGAEGTNRAKMIAA